MKKKVLKRRIDFIKKPAVNYLFKENHRRNNTYAKYYEELKIKEKTILYESRDGNSMTDSPFAMFMYMLNKESFQDFLHIWSVQDFEALSPVIDMYKNMPNVKFVRRNSNNYLKCLASCEYLVNNATFQSFYIPKSGQTYINTWHGTPLKYMGFDIPGNPAHSQNVVRNFLSADYILSPNQHTTKVLTDSYKLNGLYEGEILEEGYPRIDFTINTEERKYEDYLRSLGIGIKKGKENILYAPTWKGTNISKVNNDVLQIIADIEYLKEEIGSEYNILVKVHPYLYKEAVKYSELNSLLIPDFADTNELLATIDILITDYSSIFFDYLVTNKPILFYTWDADAYKEERGQYLNNDELPGPLLFNYKELADAIRNLETVKEEYSIKYKKAREKFVNHEDGNVTERIVNYIFLNSADKINKVTCTDISKEKILIYPGGMKNNGITTSFINLMDNIDYKKYDVSCFTATPRSSEVINNLKRVNPNVRFLFKPGLPVYKVNEVYKDYVVHNRGENGFVGKMIYPESAYEREHIRLFGKTKFDYAIDFSGYSLFWSKYILGSEAKKKICYMHNDLLSESEKVINGKRPHRVNLRSLFSAYRRFDKLVSVSKGTMELNRKNLIEYAGYDKFDYVMNSINPEKILQTETASVIEGISSEPIFSVENYKARAKLKDVSDYLVWNTLPDNKDAKYFQLESLFKDTEVLITRKATKESETYYKFSYCNQVIGWISSQAMDILPDNIVEEKTVNKLAKLNKTNGNHIWSKPYKIAGTQKVSGSSSYKDIVFEIDKEATTQHSTYSRISINQIFIGWIDNRALQFIHSCTIVENMKTVEKRKARLKRKYIKTRNYLKHKNFINNLENRTLRERNIYKSVFAEIAYPEKHIIWNKAYPNYKVKKIAQAEDWKNEIVKVETLHKTRKGSYYEFSLQGKKIGWLDSKAFKIIKDNNADKSIIETAEKKGYKLLKNSGSQRAIKKTAPAAGLNKNTKILSSIMEPEPGKLNLVNMGRLSPEKGQDNLIKAFAMFHKEYPSSNLYILGEGPLKDYLQLLINDLGMEDSIHLLGQLEKPFPFMRKCDCFVLSSHYEGQPMVLLEAMTLGMKILATDIVANRTVLENGKYGELVEDNVEGLLNGLYSLKNNKNGKQEKFDYLQYNEMAMSSFYKCIK